MKEPTSRSTDSAITGLTTQQRIVDASLGLFAARGFHGTGIRHIAEAAGISTAALYHYMGTKEDLLLHIMRECMIRLTSSAQLAMANLAGPARHLVCLARVLVITEATYRLTIVGDTEIRVLSPEGANEIIPLRDEHERLWAQTISAGVATGSFHVDDPALTRFALLEMCTGVAHWFYPSGRLPLSEIASRYGDMVLALVDARVGNNRVTSADLQMHDAQIEIEIVRKEFESFCSPHAIPTNVMKMPSSGVEPRP